jgi:UDP-N-acetylmuramoyl-L-alanyl-D-glutamate--2,6-diaminopimelate ligase
VVTSDNPRTEDPLGIIAGICGGMLHPAGATVIEDRAAAIGWAIANAGDSDTVLVAGKGHELYQEVNGEKHPFSDTVIAAECLHARAGGRT